MVYSGVCKTKQKTKKQNIFMAPRVQRRHNRVRRRCLCVRVAPLITLPSLVLTLFKEATTKNISYSSYLALG